MSTRWYSVSLPYLSFLVRIHFHQLGLLSSPSCKGPAYRGRVQNPDLTKSPLNPQTPVLLKLVRILDHRQHSTSYTSLLHFSNPHSTSQVQSRYLSCCLRDERKRKQQSFIHRLRRERCVSERGTTVSLRDILAESWWEPVGRYSILDHLVLSSGPD